MRNKDLKVSRIIRYEEGGIFIGQQIDIMELYEKLDIYQKEEKLFTRKAENLFYLSKAKISLVLEDIQGATNYLEQAINMFYIDVSNFGEFFMLSVFLNRLEVFYKNYKEHTNKLNEMNESFEQQLWGIYLKQLDEGKKINIHNLHIESWNLKTNEQLSLFCYIVGILVDEITLQEEYMQMAYEYYPCNLAAAEYLFHKEMLKETKVIKKLYENDIALVSKTFGDNEYCKPIDFSFLPLGGGNDIGASCYLMRLGEQKIIIDVGCKVSGKEIEYPDFEKVQEDIEEVRVVILTHAHLDHCGGIIRLYERNRKIVPIMTAETKALMKLNMAYSLSKEEYILLEELLEKSITCSFDTTLSIGKENITIEFLKAGHILGAAMVVVANEQTKILITGDFSISDQRTVKGAKLPASRNVDVMIMETTCGGDETRKIISRKLVEKQLEYYVTQKINEGKKVLIPAFAIGRAQEIIQILKEAAKKNDFRLYVDGSAIEVSHLYDKYGGGEILSKGVYEVPIKQYETRSDFIEQEFMNNRSCMVATSGMLQEGSTALEYAKYILQSEDGVCILTGYQANDTIGARLKAQMDMVCQRYIEIEGQIYAIKSELSEFNLSAHPDVNELLASVASVNPRYAILAHGSFKGDKSYIHRILEKKANLHVIQSENGKEIIIKERQLR